MEEPNVIYFDTISCNLASTSGVPPQATYNQARTIPYLKNPEDYYGAVISFYINDTSIPVITPDIVPYQSNPNLTVYTVSLQAQGQTVTQNVIFEPQNLVVEVPLGPSLYPDGLPNYKTGYYNIQSYAFFMGLVNNAFETAYTALQVLVPSLPIFDPPILNFDSATNLFSLTGTNSLYNNDTASPTPIYIFMNSPLYHLFEFANYFKIVNGIAENQIIMNANTSIIDTTNDVITNIQEVYSVDLWNTITNIVITTANIPAVQTNVGNPQVYYNGQVLPISTNNSNTRQVMLDFPYTLNSVNQPISYVPTAQYQLFEMNSSEPLYTMDWQMSYRARTGLLYPVFLNSGTVASLKLGFFKKSSFKHLKAIV
jgi:hypothetical protein